MASRNEQLLEAMLNGENVNFTPQSRNEALMQQIIKNGGSGGTQSDWNQTDSSAADFIKNKPFAIVNLDFETFSIDKTAAEIKQLALEGKIVLLGADGARFSSITDVDGNLTGVSASVVSVLPASSDTIPVQATTYLFDLDGNFVDIEIGMIETSRV